jgi:hypothetical protein
LKKNNDAEDWKHIFDCCRENVLELIDKLHFSAFMKK